MGSSADWADTIGALRDEFYCIALDLPGHGRSIALQDANRYKFEWTCSQITEALQVEGYDRGHLIGYSMGGRIALFFAAHHPEWCRSVILESCSPGLESEAERAERRGMDEARAVRLETGDFATFLEAWYDQPLFRTYRDRPDLLHRMIASKHANEPTELARSLRGMGTGQQPSLWDRLPDVNVRVLAIAGALDGKYVEIAQRMAVLMPNVHTAIIPNAGHNLHAERPGVFNEIVLDFLLKAT